MEKASFIVREPDGTLVEVGPLITLDRETVVAESKRLRAKYGPNVHIDSSQIVAARSRFSAREEALTA